LLHELAVALVVGQVLQSDGVAGAGEVLDLDVAGQLGVLHRLGRGPGRLVEPTARRRADQDVQPGDLPVTATATATTITGLATGRRDQAHRHGHEQPSDPRATPHGRRPFLPSGTLWRIVGTAFPADPFSNARVVRAAGAPPEARRRAGTVGA